MADLVRVDGVEHDTGPRETVGMVRRKPRKVGPAFHEGDRVLRQPLTRSCEVDVLSAK